MRENSQDMRIIFFGTPEFGAIILEKLIQTDLKPVLVVTAPDKPIGRKQLVTPPPVKVIAEKHNIPVLQPERLDQTINYQLKTINPDLIVLAAYGQIIPKEILELPKFGALNVHPSLLPKYRGASPIQAAILNGDTETGATIMLMDEELDHGPIVAQRVLQTPIDRMTYLELHNSLAELGGELLVETISRWVKGEMTAHPQDHSKATETQRIKKEDGRIDWSKPALYIERKVRALNPWPGTYAKLQVKSAKVKIIKILKASVLEHSSPTSEETPGKTFLTSDGKLAAQTGKDALIIEELQLEGGKPMPAKEFLLGHKDFVGTILS